MKVHLSPPRWVAVVALASLVASACGSATTSPTPGVSIVPPSAGPAVTPEPGQTIPVGGTIVYTTYAPGVAALSPRMVAEGIGFQLSQLMSRGLAEHDLTGAYVPILATEVPDLSNGGVSPDGLTVTWHLKPGLTWSDGSPLTSDDLRFTWEVCGDPANACLRSDGLTLIESVETPNDQTIVLHYKQPFFDYKGQWRDGILPRKSADVGAPADVANWKYNQTVKPNLGPFSVADYKVGESINLVKNPNFYLASEGKPYLDGINVVIRPETEAQRQAILQGAADVAPWLTQPAPAVLQELVDKGFKIGSGASPYLNHLQINMWDPKDPTRTKPHPTLADAKVREAILLGSDVSKITANWNLPGVFEAKRITSRFDWYGPDFACNIEPLPYDPEKAKQLLDEAGWKVGADGIREKDGKKLQLRVSTYTGFGQEDNVVVWISELKNLGIDAQAFNHDVAQFYTGFKDKSNPFIGDFDLLYYDYAHDFGNDPQNDAAVMYPSEAIPSDANAGGRNFVGFRDPEIDQWVKEAGSTLDNAIRSKKYCQIAEKAYKGLFAEAYTGLVPNFQYSSPKLKGWGDNEAAVWFGSDSENWYLEP